jgi:hypothetical protein
MSQKVLPNCIELLLAVTTQTENISDLLSSNTTEFKALKSLLNSKGTLNSKEAFSSSTQAITYFQLLLLINLSMHEGIFIPSIKTFSSQNNKVKITWDSGVRDEFEFGKTDENFIKFYKYFQKKVFNKPRGAKDIAVSDVKNIAKKIKQYLLTLDNTESRIKTLLKRKQELIALLGDSLNRDLLFIIMSALPADQLNALFLYIYRFLPEDLSITSKSGNIISITNVLQTPSSDTKYLLEKVMVYFDLYFATKLPIIQHITQTKTKEFLTELINNDKVYESICQSLKSLKDQQVDLRKSVYTFFDKHLELLLK